MNRQVIIPDSHEHWLELRSKDLTSTDIAALFGCSPYKTKFGLWHEMRGSVVTEFNENERTKWGNYLETAIAEACAVEEGLTIRPMKEYIRLPDLRIGSSFDFCIVKPAVDLEAPLSVGQICNANPMDVAVLEIKNVDSLQFMRGWVEDDDGNIEAPLHIEMQMQHEMLVSGLSRVELRALVGGNSIRRITREADEATQEAILAKCAEFWASIDADIAPDPDFEADAATIKALYSFADPGTLMNLTTDERAQMLAVEYKAASEEIKAAEVRKAAAKSELLTILGDAEKGQGLGFKISAGVIGPTVIETYERKGYRDFRIYWSKQK